MTELNRFIDFTRTNVGLSKVAIVTRACDIFGLIQDGGLFYCSTFAVRFSYSRSGSFSNTVLSLSKLQKFDGRPVVACLITENENRLYLANSTFLKKISHSSQILSATNIRGSFNGSDIAKEFLGIENSPENFSELFAIHHELGFDGNLDRLVDSTLNISPSGAKFEIKDGDLEHILKSVDRADQFCRSNDFDALRADLDSRVLAVQREIVVASHIENGKIRGGLIECLIAGDDEVLRETLIGSINNPYDQWPEFKSRNDLGDYVRNFDQYKTKTDVKTKIMLLHSNPKAYNIDKFLEFMAQDQSVLLFYLVCIDADRIFRTALISVYHKQLVGATLLLKHWAGRNSRGVTQFKGSAIVDVVTSQSNNIDRANARKLLN